MELNHKSNYQDFGRYVEVDLNITGDAEATLPALIEAVKRLITRDRKRAFEQRGAKIAEANQRVRDRNRELAAVAWDASPISTARLAAELWAQMKNEDWSLVSNDRYPSYWCTRAVGFQEALSLHRRARRRGHRLRCSGGRGRGSRQSQAWALDGEHSARRRHQLCSRRAVDGRPSQHSACSRIMHNNRAYHQEHMYVQMVANKNDRGIDRSHIGTVISSPNIDYAMMAKTYGMYGEGPISDPKDLGAGDPPGH